MVTNSHDKKDAKNTLSQWISRTALEPEEVSLEFVRNLGSGRAAEVQLVKNTLTGELYAEKLFNSKKSVAELGRNFIYWTCFQSAFPYNSKDNAIKASMFRRKVLRELTEFWFGKPLVADAFYTRWDEKSQGYILGTEYIEGRGPKPGEFNPRSFRNFFLNYPIRFCKMLFGNRDPKIEGPSWEIDEVATDLDKFKSKFHEAGFIGSVWQVDKMLSVPTSNLLRDKNGNWILVDVESGMPALVLLSHIWSSIRFGSFPLFDDTDFPKLRKYLDANRVKLIDSLGEDRVKRLDEYVEKMEFHTLGWKSSEAAVFTHKHRLITDSQLRSKVRKGYAEHWEKTGRISKEKAAAIEKSGPRFCGYLAFDLSRSAVLGAKVTVRSMGSFIKTFGQSVILALRLVWSAFFNDRFIREFTENYVDEKIDDWKNSQRLNDEEVANLRERVSSPAMAEYLKGFMAHLGLNFLEPPFVANFVAIFLAAILDQPAIILVLFMGPILRTLYTLSRMVCNRGKGIPYSTAFIAGAVPKLGTMAYLIQMSTAHPNLSRFLARWQLSNVGCHVPLFGGPDSRLEHASIKSADMGFAMQYEISDWFNKLKRNHR